MSEAARSHPSDGCGTNMTKGDKVTTRTTTFEIVEKIGEGAYGAVYRVTSEADGKQYAMKVERKLPKQQHSKLSMEVHLLKVIAEQKSGRSHFVKMIDRSKKPNYYFFVMTLVGESLSELQRQRAPSVFSVATGLGVGFQCLEAIEQLHKVGYVHRDIEGNNFTIGRLPFTHLIYLLDFGISRRYLNERNIVKTPRAKVVGFKGTVPYGAMDCHLYKELGPKHDCESWVYMVVHFCNEKGLPWHKDKDPGEVLRKKRAARTLEGRQRLFQPMCETAFSAILDYIDRLCYSDQVDYAFVYRTVVLAAHTLNVDLGAKFDWESGSVDDDEIVPLTNKPDDFRRREPPKGRDQAA